MVKEVLTTAGFIENKTFKETRFIAPPTETFCVYLDGFIRRGADNLNLVTEHTVTIEMYSYKADSRAEKRIEGAFDALNIAFEKGERTWIQDEQLYQVTYDFDYIEKNGGK